jgi:hypothetical protein
MSTTAERTCWSASFGEAHSIPAFKKLSGAERRGTIDDDGTSGTTRYIGHCRPLRYRRAMAVLGREFASIVVGGWKAAV